VVHQVGNQYIVTRKTPQESLGSLSDPCVSYSKLGKSIKRHNS